MPKAKSHLKEGTLSTMHVALELVSILLLTWVEVLGRGLAVVPVQLQGVILLDASYDMYVYTVYTYVYTWVYTRVMGCCCQTGQ